MQLVQVRVLKSNLIGSRFYWERDTLSLPIDRAKDLIHAGVVELVPDSKPAPRTADAPPPTATATVTPAAETADAPPVDKSAPEPETKPRKKR